MDDFNDKNKPSHPELLDELAQAFVAAKFDLRFILRAICLSRPISAPAPARIPARTILATFARMAVKGLSGEQFFDSLALATGYRESPNDRGFGLERTTVRTQFLDQFARAAS